jgi:hypothetical protein
MGSRLSEYIDPSDFGSDSVFLKISKIPSVVRICNEKYFYLFSIHFSTNQETSLSQLENLLQDCGTIIRRHPEAIIIAIGSFNAPIDSPHFIKLYDVHTDLTIQQLSPKFYSSNKIRNITNQFEKVNEIVQEKVDNALIISRRSFPDLPLELLTCGLEGPLEADEPFPSQYPTDHYGVMLEFQHIRILSLNLLGESRGKHFHNLYEFYPVELYSDLDLFRHARQTVNESLAFREFYHQGMELARMKDPMAYDRQLRHFKIFDCHPPTNQFRDHPYFQELLTKREKLRREFEDETKDDSSLRALGEKMLAYQETIINHETTLPLVNKWLESLIQNPKLTYTTLLETYRDQNVHIFCLQEMNDELLELLFEHPTLTLDYKVKAPLDQIATTITRQNINELKKQNENLKTYGVILVRNSPPHGI